MGVTPEHYEAAREEVGWERDAPVGGLFHVAWFQDDGIHVLDVWENAEDFQAFVDERLMPGMQKLGIKGQPVVDIKPAYRIYDVQHKEARY